MGKAKLVVSDSCMKKLEPIMQKAANFLKKAIDEKTPVRVKFHDDCDGVCSGIAITLALQTYRKKKGLPEKLECGDNAIESSQAHSAIYLEKNAFEDLKACASFDKKPLFVLLDFGANSESIGALNSLKNAGAKLVVIDHHPPAKEVSKIADFFVSSHAHDKTGGHCAGLLATQTAHFIDKSVAEKYAWYALQGDKSPLAKNTEFKEAVALDYLVHHSEAGTSAEYYAEKLEDEQAIEIAWRLAKRSEQKVLEHATRHLTVKGCDCDLKFVLVDLEKIVKTGTYPSKGKAINAVHIMESEKLEKPVVSFGYTKQSVSVRANDFATDTGFRASNVIKQLKKEFERGITSGGGHDAAASIRFEEDYLKPILIRFQELSCNQLEQHVAKHGPCQCGGKVC
ncbi:MAG: DHH family phosphoesterase [Candidatus Micrarchaeia archaeon]